MRYLRLVVFIVVCLFTSSCGLLYNYESFGVLPIKVSDSITIYAIRAVWGIVGNADYLFLSPRQNPCELINKKNESAYAFNANGVTSFFYQVSNQKLEIFTRYDLTPPRTENFPVAVIVHKLTVQEFNALYSRSNELGLKTVILETDPLVKCAHSGNSS